MSERRLDGSSMRALRAHRRGGPDVLVLDEDVPLPRLGLGDVLVAVGAASFTPTELDWPSTWTDRSGRDRTPVTVAHEVSGVVAALGYGTVGLSLGEAVYGLTDWYRDGAAADFVAVEARNAAPKPTTLGHVDAAAVPMAATTAWQGLFDHGELRAGQTVLIHGAGGGVGTFAIQLAHQAGATVLATGRAPHAQLLLDLGADQVLDTGRQRFEEALDPVDLVLDLIGADVAKRSWPLVKTGGALVSVVGGTDLGDPRPNTRAVFFIVKPDEAVLREVAKRIDDGVLRPVLGAAFDLVEGRSAFEAKRSGGITGKVALRVRAPGEELHG